MFHISESSIHLDKECLLRLRDVVYVDSYQINLVVDYYFVLGIERS